MMVGDKVAGRRPDRAPDRARARSSRRAPRGRRGTAASRSRAIARASASTTGRATMAVDARPAVARQMLDHRQHAAGEEALDQRAAKERDQRRIRGRGAVADRRGPARAAPDRAPARRPTLMPSARRSCAISRACSHAASSPACAIALGQPADPARRQPRAASSAGAGAPRGRLPGRSAPAHRRGRTVARSSSTRRAHLGRVGAIAGEQDEAAKAACRATTLVRLGRARPATPTMAALTDRPRCSGARLGRARLSGG